MKAWRGTKGWGCSRQHRSHLPRPSLCGGRFFGFSHRSQLRRAERCAYLRLPGCVPRSLPRTVSCCFRPRERGADCAGEMPLAGYRVVDAFGNDVRAFVWRLQARSSGRVRLLQRCAADLCLWALEELSTDTVLKCVRHSAAPSNKVIRQMCDVLRAAGK